MMLRTFKGKSPIVDPTAWVSEFAYVVGDVEIGPYVSVWPGVVIRADCGKITVGSHSNIQDTSVVHGDGDVDIGSYVTLGHGVICHGRTIGDHCLLGNNCTVNDSAVVGENSIIASGAVVPDNRVIPPNSFAVGVPAEVKGTLSDRHREMVQANADDYVILGQQHKEEGL